jgi:SAM-dependent methyltransferase
VDNLDRDKLISKYYQTHFEVLYNAAGILNGMTYFHSHIEKYWSKPAKKILEVGAGNGEHLQHLANTTLDNLVSYDLLDIRSKPKNFEQFLGKLRIPDNLRNPNLINYIEGSVQDIPAGSENYDRIVSTCLFHHIENPLLAFQELRRVLAPGGEIAIGLPTDPGLFNRFAKYFFTYRNAKKIGITDPRFMNALEHRNHIGGLIDMARAVYKNDIVKIYYRPFFIKSWNLNLMVVIKVEKHKNRN